MGLLYLLGNNGAYVPPASYDPTELADDYLAAVSSAGGTVSGAMQTKVTELIVGLYDAGLWQRIKCLYLFHGNTNNAALLNAINPTTLLGAYSGTWVGTPTLNADGGFTPSSGNYFNSNFHPDGGGLLDLNGGGIFFYGTSNIAGGEYPIGLESTFFLAPNANGTQAFVRCSGNTSTAVAAVDTSGFHWGGREANSENVRAYRNGTQYIAETIAFASHYAGIDTTSRCFIGARRDQVTPATNASTMPLRLAGFSLGLTSAQVAAFNTLVQEYVL